MKRPFIIFGIILIIAILAENIGIFNSAENSLGDYFFQNGDHISNNIYVIGIDEETLDEYGSFDVWGRSKTTELINLLMSDESHAPSVIAIDVGVYGHKDEEIDAALVEAVKNAGNVVLVDTATFGNVVSSGTEVLVYEEPFEELKEVCKGHGHANVELDEDGVVRRTIGDIYYKGEKRSSFDYEVYKAYLDSIGEELNEESNGYFGKDSGNYIVYSGNARTYYGSIGAGCSFKRVLEGDYPTKTFKDAIVFIGAYASGMQDNYYTSIEKDTKMNGVEIHANIVNQLINGTSKYELNDYERIIILALIGALSMLFVKILRTRYFVLAELSLAALYVGLIKVLDTKFNILISIFYPLVLIFVLMVSYIIYSYIHEYRERNRLVTIYNKYLSPEVANALANKGKGFLKLGGSKKDIAVLFVDIRNFTTISERLNPEEIVEMLNKYFKITTQAIFDNEGTVDKFIGDATMGIFNAPLDVDDYIYKAVLAGLEMARNARNIDEELPEKLRGKVGFGVGINCGEAVVGNIGTDFRMEYTAIGDVVNTASRIEGQAKAGEVVVSFAVYEKIKERVECELIGEVQLKGKNEKVQIYRALRVK